MLDFSLFVYFLPTSTIPSLHRTPCSYPPPLVLSTKSFLLSKNKQHWKSKTQFLYKLWEATGSLGQHYGALHYVLDSNIYICICFGSKVVSPPNLNGWSIKISKHFTCMFDLVIIYVIKYVCIRHHNLSSMLNICWGG